MSASSWKDHLGITFSGVLRRQAERFGDKVFLTFLEDGRRFSYRDIDRLSNKVAYGLLKRGVAKGDHVAMLMENSPEQVIAYFALGKIGAVVVPINIAAKGQFIEYYLADSDSIALIADEKFLPEILGLEHCAKVQTLFVRVEVPMSEVPIHSSLVVASFTTLFDDDESAPEVDVSCRDPYAIMYTSGTTGPSKGNIFTQIHALTFGYGLVEPNQYSSEDVYYISLPLFHAGAYNTGLLLMLMVGGSVALARRFSVTSFWSQIRESGATCGMMLGMGHILMGQPPSSEDRNTRLRLLVTSPMLQNAAEFERRFGPRLVQGYGLTDYCVATTQPLDAPNSKRMSMGVPLQGVEVRLVDDDDNDVPVGDVGEIVLRKNHPPFATAQGYYKRAEATVEAWRNLWFHTGDRARRDEDGYFYFVDRKKEALRRRGENVSTYEVEMVLQQHEAVIDVAAYPVTAAAGDDEVGVSVVIRKERAISARDLFRYCYDNMPHYMVPRFIDLRDELPRTLTNKLRKQELRESVEADTSAVWDSEREGLMAQLRPRKAVQV